MKNKILEWIATDTNDVHYSLAMRFSAEQELTIIKASLLLTDIDIRHRLEEAYNEREIV